VGSDSQATRRQILDAALRCFAEQGFAGTTFADVSRAAGLSRSALYPYFANKVALYHALLADIQQAHRAALETTLTGGAPFADKLEAVLRVFAEDHQTHYDRSTFLAAVPLEMQRHPELAEGVGDDPASTPQLVRDFLAEAIERGEITDAFSPDDLLVCLLGGIMGMSLFQRSMGAGRVDRAVRVIPALLEGRFLKSRSE
jgi:AcrR family transcriptional regulator